MYSIDTDGFTVVQRAFDADEIRQLIAGIDAVEIQHPGAAGMRSLLRDSDAIEEFASIRGAEFVAQHVGRQPRPVRAILFDKNEEANWYVRWHQDRTIPVAERIEVDGFSAWSVKDGVLHVYPPAEVLAEMISMRIHLDRADETNGAIRFVRGSHKYGVLDDERKNALKGNAEDVVIVGAEAGDVILMRPLILHASSKATSSQRRRVLHIEYATTELPAGLRWGKA